MCLENKALCSCGSDTNRSAVKSLAEWPKLMDGVNQKAERGISASDVCKLQCDIIMSNSV